MAQACSICNHNNRLEIDKLLVEGRSLSSISRRYDVSLDALSNHRNKHISRQLHQAMMKRENEQGQDLLQRIDNLINKCELIFERNFAAKKDLTALKAIAEQRQTFQLLAQISVEMHKAKLAELEAYQYKSGAFDSHRAEQAQKSLQVLSTSELALFVLLQDKIYRQDQNMPIVDDDVFPEGYFTSVSGRGMSKYKRDALKEILPAASDDMPATFVPNKNDEPDYFEHLRNKKPVRRLGE